MTDRSPQSWYVDCHYRLTGQGSTQDQTWSETGVFGPYEVRRLAEQTMANLAARPDVISAFLRDPEPPGENPTTGRWHAPGLDEGPEMIP